MGCSRGPVAGTLCEVSQTPCKHVRPLCPTTTFQMQASCLRLFNTKDCAKCISYPENHYREAIQRTKIPILHCGRFEGPSDLLQHPLCCKGSVLPLLCRYAIDDEQRNQHRESICD
jgi:hypothetical protein